MVKSAAPPVHSQPPLGRRDRRRAETRERLFRAALTLFAERGFPATTVEDITEAADVGKGTFFNYFPSKEHIFGAFGEIQIGNVHGALEDARHGEPVERVLRRLGRALAVEPGRSPALVRSMVVAVGSSDEVRHIMLHNLERGRVALAELMAIGQQRGEIRSDRDPEELARLFQQSFFGMLVMWSLHPPSSMEGRLDGTIEVFWNGIRGRPAAHGRRTETPAGKERRT